MAPTENSAYINISIPLDSPEANALKIDRSVATSTSNTFLKIGQGCANDTNGNVVTVPVNGAGVATGIQAANVVQDATAPNIINFDLNINATDDRGTLTLTFDEAVDVSTFDAERLSLQNAASAALETHTLTGGTNATQTDGTVVEFHLLLTDTNILKQFERLAVNASSTFLAAAVGVVDDTAGNPAASITVGAALPCENDDFVPDSIDPRLLSYSINLNDGTITFHFSETVDVSTIEVDKLTLQSTP